MNLTVLGSNTLLGQYLIKHIQKNVTDVRLVSWTLEGPLKNLLGGINAESLIHFSGLSNLKSAIDGADTVVNFHEYHDLTMFPRKDLLQIHNVAFVEAVLSILNSQTHTPTLIHQSSTFVQCSSRWPNINEGENNPSKYDSEWPFPDYCQSKYDAESLIHKGKHRAVILRIVPPYGVGDQSSVITDVIRISEVFGVVPILGDRDGLMQMAFAGNIIQAVMLAVDHLKNPSVEDSHSDSSTDQNRVDVILIADDTPKRDTFTTYKPLLLNGKRTYSSWSLPFILCYYAYLLLGLVLNLFSMVVTLPSFICDLPHPSFFYFYFHHWTFFNTMKSRFMLKYHPAHDFESSLEICKNYYRTLPASRCRWSWKAAEYLADS